MIQVLIFSILGLFLSACLLIQAMVKLSDKTVILTDKKDSYSWVFPIVVSSILLIFSFINTIIVSEEVNSPHEVDVVNGKASYVESYHVINNDTIKTYKIVWDKNEDKDR